VVVSILSHFAKLSLFHLFILSFSAILLYYEAHFPFCDVLSVFHFTNAFLLHEYYHFCCFLLFSALLPFVLLFHQFNDSRVVFSLFFPSFSLSLSVPSLCLSLELSVNYTLLYFPHLHLFVSPVFHFSDFFVFLCVLFYLFTFIFCLFCAVNL
jgi:hypothetical protein